MRGTVTFEMSELEKLRAELFLARNHRAELSEQLAAAKQMIEQLYERLTLSDKEHAILKGQADGCIRIGELAPILKRVFRETM